MQFKPLLAIAVAGFTATLSQAELIDPVFNPSGKWQLTRQDSATGMTQYTSGPPEVGDPFVTSKFLDFPDPTLTDIQISYDPRTDVLTITGGNSPRARRFQLEKLPDDESAIVGSPDSFLLYGPTPLSTPGCEINSGLGEYIVFTESGRQMLYHRVMIVTFETIPGQPKSCAEFNQGQLNDLQAGGRGRVIYKALDATQALDRSRIDKLKEMNVFDRYEGQKVSR